jgi:hypothetical protein
VAAERGGTGHRLARRLDAARVRQPRLHHRTFDGVGFSVNLARPPGPLAEMLLQAARQPLRRYG